MLSSHWEGRGGAEGPCGTAGIIQLQTEGRGHGYSAGSRRDIPEGEMPPVQPRHMITSLQQRSVKTHRDTKVVGLLAIHKDVL